MQTRWLWTGIVCAALAGCAGRDATTDERTLALSAVKQARMVPSLDGTPALVQAMVSRVAPRPAELRAESDTVMPTPDVTCDISAEQQVGDARVRSGTCNGGALRVELSLTQSGDRYHVEITLAGDYAGAQVAVKQTYQLELRADYLDGSMREDSQARLGTSSGHRTTGITFDGVALDASGCPVGGTIHADRTEDLDGREQSATIDLALGPACGEVHALR